MTASAAALKLAKSAHAQSGAPIQIGAAARGRGISVPTAVVEAKDGAIRGLLVDGVRSFNGIRYGAAPIGHRRWMPPEPTKACAGIYDASDFGAPAMQLASASTVDTANDFGFQMHQIFTTPSELKIMNEDCLYLNVWTPGRTPKNAPSWFGSMATAWRGWAMWWRSASTTA